jgi:hypothetical protein
LCVCYYHKDSIELSHHQLFFYYGTQMSPTSQALVLERALSDFIRARPSISSRQLAALSASVSGELSYIEAAWGRSSSDFKVKSRLPGEDPLNAAKPSPRLDAPKEFVMYIERYLRRAVDGMVDLPQPQADERALDTLRKCAAMGIVSASQDPSVSPLPVDSIAAQLMQQKPSLPLSLWLLDAKRAAAATLESSAVDCAQACRNLALLSMAGMVDYGIQFRLDNDQSRRPRP